MYIDKVKIEFPIDVKLVYELSQDLKDKTKLVEKIQKLSLNENSLFGLKKDKGLYNSDEWWDNINKGLIPSIYRYGVIIDTYKAGQDNINRDNSFRFKGQDDVIYEESIYNIYQQDYDLFKKGHFVVIFYVLEELKTSTIEKPDYIYSVIEMAVSEEQLSLS